MDWLENWNQALDYLEENLDREKSSWRSWGGWLAVQPTTFSGCFPTWPACL